VVSRSVSTDTPVAVTNLESENVSSENTVRRSSLVAIEQRQHEQDDAGLPLLQQKAHHAGREQDDLHQVGVLAEERAPPGLHRPGVELVRPESFGTRGGLGRAETRLLVYLFRLQDPVGVQRVPYGPIGARRHAGCGRAGRSSHLSSHADQRRHLTAAHGLRPCPRPVALPILPEPSPGFRHP
jgi:hypothetical protein